MLLICQLSLLATAVIILFLNVQNFCLLKLLLWLDLLDVFFFFLKGDLLDVIVIVKSIANQRKIRALTTTSDDNLKILLAWFCPFAWWWLDQNRKFHLEQISQVSFSSRVKKLSWMILRGISVVTFWSRVRSSSLQLIVEEMEYGFLFHESKGEIWGWSLGINSVIHTFPKLRNKDSIQRNTEHVWFWNTLWGWVSLLLSGDPNKWRDFGMWLCIFSNPMAQGSMRPIAIVLHEVLTSLAAWCSPLCAVMHPHHCWIMVISSLERIAGWWMKAERCKQRKVNY